MGVIIFTPKNHYYSPIVLKRIKADKVIATPTLSKHEGIFKIIKRAGFDFFFSMMFLKLYYLFINNNIKEICKNRNIEFHYVRNINSSEADRLISKDDIVIVLFFNQIIKKEIIDKCRAIINVHPSLLPYYKGVMPVFHVLANNEKITGITTHYLEESIDTGNIILQKKIAIENDSFDSLYRKCALASIELIENTIKEVIEGNNGKKQGKGNYFSFVTKEDMKRFRKNNKRFL